MKVIVECPDRITLELIARQSPEGHPKRSQAIELPEATAKRLMAAIKKAYAKPNK